MADSRDWQLCAKETVTNDNFGSMNMEEQGQNCPKKEGFLNKIKLEELILNRKRPLILFVDHATFHHSKPVRDYVSVHRSQLRIFFLPKRAPEFNPDEQVWNEIKNNRIGKQPIKNKVDLKDHLTVALDSLKQNTQRVVLFFHMPDTKYASDFA